MMVFQNMQLVYFCEMQLSILRSQRQIETDGMIGKGKSLFEINWLNVARLDWEIKMFEQIIEVLKQ